ncbi:hypothetical protein COO60DRAFT_1635239 [Scenedesmus sp. NREL 46B-D3]|nr:hypothetical protein COO60DRAFT_1635239 [Scenedesmus sp. NREL 46B-D3]
MNRQKYERLKQSAEQEVLEQCSFKPKTGRGPQHAATHQGLPVAERLYHTARERQAKLERKAAEAAASSTQGCTFKPCTNAAAQGRYLAAYEYVPLHERLGEVLRSKNERLAALQMQVERDSSDAAPFTPRINPRSSVLALRASSRGRGRGVADCSGGGGAGGGGGGGDDGGEDGQQRRDRERQRDSSRGHSLRRSRSEADVAAAQAACTFTPRINASSKALLQQAGEIPAGFLERQQYFERLAREKRQLLQLAVEDQHCSFSPAHSVSEFGRSSGSLDGACFLDRIERLANKDKRTQEAARAVLAEHVHNAECTFRPEINPRSQRMGKPTPLQELYENSKGLAKRFAVAQAVESQRQQECTFTPNLSKPGLVHASPPEAALSLSASEVDAVVERLHSAARNKEGRGEAALSFKQYQELKACTFTPEITRGVPQQTGPVLVRGLGRFMELKEMAKRQAEQRAAVEAKVFMTQLPAGTPRAAFTVPEPFQLGSGARQASAQLRRSRAEASASQAALQECTFKPRIKPGHCSRQQRVRQLLEGGAGGAAGRGGYSSGGSAEEG